MGIPSLVLQQYSTLGIKEIMHDPQCHIAHSRISILLPVLTQIATTSTTTQNTGLCESINGAIVYYKNAIRNLNNCVRNIWEYAIHDRIVGFVKLKLDFQRSFTRQMLVLERRIARLSERIIPDLDLEDVGM